MSNLPLRKNHGSVSSNDSGHSEALSYCEGYHLTSSILHNAPIMPPQQTPPAIQPRRHSSIQGGGSQPNTNLYQQQMIQPNNINNNSTKQLNGDLNHHQLASSSMAPPRTIPRSMPFPVLPSSGTNVAGYNIVHCTQQQYNQMRHAGEFFFFIEKRLMLLR